MASKAGPFSRSEIQEAIKTQGEIIRQLKLEEQTDEVKKKVKSCCFFSQPISFNNLEEFLERGGYICMGEVSRGIKETSYN